MGFKIENVFRKQTSFKKVGEMEIETFITDDKKTLVMRVALGKFVVEKSFQNNLYGKESLEDFSKRVQTEEDFKRYLGVL